MEIYEKPSDSDTCELYRRLNKRSENRFTFFLKRKWRSVFQRTTSIITCCVCVFYRYL